MEGGGGADLNQELKILLNLIKNGREGWGGLYNLTKINFKQVAQRATIAHLRAIKVSH